MPEPLCAFCRTAPATTTGLFFGDPSCQPCLAFALRNLGRAELEEPVVPVPRDCDLANHAGYEELPT